LGCLVVSSSLVTSSALAGDALAASALLILAVAPLLGWALFADALWRHPTRHHGRPNTGASERPITWEVAVEAHRDQASNAIPWLVRDARSPIAEGHAREQAAPIASNSIDPVVLSHLIETGPVVRIIDRPDR
jgi:hypothetical protein